MSGPRRRWTLVLPLVAGICGAAAAPAEGPARNRIEIVGATALSPDGARLAVEWCGDLWIASSRGGEARSIASHPAIDTQPAFSPDGRELAFVSNRDDTWQIYTVPAGGGVPEQRTWHTAGRTLYEYTPDGAGFVQFARRDGKGPNPGRLYVAPRHPRGPERLLFDDQASGGALSPDGRRLLFVREGMDALRRGYRGSRAGQIWLYDLGAGGPTQIVGRATNAHSPMWKADGSGFYYIDDRTGCGNVWEHRLDTGDARALTAFNDGPVHLPALSRDGSTMVFQQLFDLYRLDLAAATPAPERIELHSLRDPTAGRIERRWYDKIWNNDDHGTLDWTADGLEMVFTAGGDVWVMDTVLRDPRPVTQDAAAQDTEARFSPDGRKIYFLRDTGDGVNVWEAAPVTEGQYWWQGGLFGLWRRQRAEQTAWWQNESFALRPLTRDRATRQELRVSPDGGALAWFEGRGVVCVHDLQTGVTRQLASQPGGISLRWSPDSRWLAAALRDSHDIHDVWIIAADGSRPPYNLSRNPNWDGDPAWSPDGRVLAFAGRTYDGETDLYYVWLAREDEERSKRDRTLEEALQKMRKTRGGGDEDGNGAAAPGRSGALTIEFDRLAERVRRVRVNGAPYQLAWTTNASHLIYMTGSGTAGTYQIEFPPEEVKPQLLSPHTGRELRVGPGNALQWMLDGLPAVQGEKFALAVYNTVDWSEYQRLGFRMIWRTLRDHFYDERRNNLDWDAMLAKYEDAAARAPEMSVFVRVARMLFGELNASHLGFTPEPREGFKTGNWAIRTLHPGLWFDGDWTGPGWKVREVIRNGPADAVRSRIEPGEIVRSINGQPLAPGMDPAEALNSREEREWQLEVEPSRGELRTVLLKPVTYEAAQELIRQQWIEDTRAQVAQVSTNRLGYLNIERMTWPSLRQFEKEIFAEGVDKDGLIIDVRNNPGGFISDFLLAILCHPDHAITVPRDGERGYPSGYLGKVIWTKPIVVLCNQNSASNAEIFSHAIKALGRGRLVGVPTQGAVISTPERKILDLGTLRMPDRGWFSIVNGEDMELHGAVPDYFLWPAPGDLPAGRDVQLDKAIEVLLREVAEDKARPRPRLTLASERPASED